jgi:hypothetical protein
VEDGEAVNPTVWREPPAMTEDYPGLVVHDGRVTGSITVGQSRLPLWAFIWSAIHKDWTDVEAGWSPTEHYGYTADDLSDFLGHLLNLRGEFGRLVLVLADMERRDRRPMGRAWWERPKKRQRVIDQLRRCLNALEAS